MYYMRTILLVILVLLLVGALPTWPYSSGWGYYPSGRSWTIARDIARPSRSWRRVIGIAGQDYFPTHCAVGWEEQATGEVLCAKLANAR